MEKLIKTKICLKCQQSKLLDNFSFYKLTRRYRCYCKQCDSVKAKEFYLKNKIKIQEKQKIYKDKNKEVLSARRKAKYIPKPKRKYIFQPVEFKPKPIILIKTQPLFDDSGQLLLIDFCHGSNKKHKNKYHKPLATINDNFMCSSCIEIESLKRITKQFQKAKKNIRHRLKSFLKRSFKYKGTKACLRNEMIGCTNQELKRHLESQFREGMSWDNYGIEGWHIDHIKPMASFNLTDPEEQKRANHYTNLQPLWAKENLTKNDYYEQK